MSHDCYVALPCGVMGLSEICDMVFPDHSHLIVLLAVILAFSISLNLMK